jgi:hypothetical protein
MSRFGSLLVSLLLLCGLAGCAGGPPKRIFPPRAELQELRVEADGSWALALRVHNYSTVPMRFSAIDLGLDVGAAPAGRIALQPGLDVAPNSIEVLQTRITPSAAAADALRGLGAGGSLAYRLRGTIETSEPREDFDIDFPSALSAVPGLDGVLR